jgi:hypothetical protein
VHKIVFAEPGTRAFLVSYSRRVSDSEPPMAIIRLFKPLLRRHLQLAEAHGTEYTWAVSGIAIATAISLIIQLATSSPSILLIVFLASLFF